ncbi:L-threonine 3-dehydrogenase [candidate division TA06 bacterium DG_24]|jgi:threonine 3-dehydrogenase|uniref:L-threonine 3-dehydrogenase n=1 Tax=candidate division TA06 bacterium DG_24 TaxID=1703770 RepID=A0A0S7WVF5_UNCT6|nr:MAG: L-threonine 3-dehydrogenase [candidate division TA06 bacterium DG_24]
MPEKMRAVVKTKAAPGAELIEVDVPTIDPDQVLVKVKATSICGTDVHIYEWDKWAQSRIHVPQTLGHEFAGEIVEVGSQVTKLKIGDYISAETHIPCNDCIQCLTGQQHICGNLKILGVDCNGCFAEYAAIPEIVAWKNDTSIPPEFATVQEPLGNAVYCTTVEPVLGKSVLIFGDGPTGLFAAGVARVAGAALIMIVGRHPVRLEIAKKMGADILINGHSDDVEAIVRTETGGVGVDVVLDMAGTQVAIDQGFRLVRKGGRVSAFGVAAGPVQLDLNNGVVFKGVTIYGINGRLMYDTWFKVANLLKYKRLDISPIVTHTLPLEEFEKGFSLMMTRPKISGKVVMFPEQ